MSLRNVGTVAALWRFPVKSMAGETVAAAAFGPSGMEGDRLWAVRDETTAAITTGRKLAALLGCSARYLAEPAGDDIPPVEITFPDGARSTSDDPATNERLSALCGRAVTLQKRRPASDREHYRTTPATQADMRHDFALGPDDPLPDFSMMPLSLIAELARYATPPGSYYDAYAVHLVTTSSLAAVRAHDPAADVDVRRFRPNVVVDTGSEPDLVENAWCAGTLRAGSFAAAVQVPTIRCAIPSRAHVGLPADPAVLRAVIDRANRCLGVYAHVAKPGRVAVGDAVEVERVDPGQVRSWMKSGATSMKRLLLRAAAAGLPEE